MATSCGYEFQKKHFGFADVKPDDFYASQWFKSRRLFACYRGAMFLYSLVWVIVNIFQYEGLYTFAYLTNWAEWTLCLYFGVSFGTVMYGVRKDNNYTNTQESSDIPNYSALSNREQDELRWFHRLCWVLATLSTDLEYLITIMFWTFLAGEEDAMPLLIIIHQHGITTLMITIDLMVSRIQFRLLHVVYVAFYGTIYTLLTLILYVTGLQTKIYNGVIDWQDAPVISTIVGLSVLCVGFPLVHFLAFGIYHLRFFLARKLAGRKRDSELDSRACQRNNETANGSNDEDINKKLNCDSLGQEESLL
ncbi:protein rolling stone-like [Styela clava]